MAQIVKSSSAVDDDQLHSALHFDGENFVGGHEQIFRPAQITSSSGPALAPRFDARDSLGRALHTLRTSMLTRTGLSSATKSPNALLTLPR